MENKSIISYGPTKFESISDFKWSIISGAEICFVWKNKMYAIDACREDGIAFSEGCYKKGDKYYNVISHTEYDPDREIVFKTPDEVLEAMIDGDRLRDIITEVSVTDRTI